MAESHVRSVIKGITWRMLGTIDTMVISYFVTGEITSALKIGGIEVFTKIFLYYLHERTWTLVKWGKRPDPLPVAPVTSLRPTSEEPGLNNPDHL